MSAWSVTLDQGETPDAWIRRYCGLVEQGACADVGPLTTPVTVDGHPGSLLRFAADTQAFVPVGDEMYVVAVWRPDSDPSTAS